MIAHFSEKDKKFIEENSDRLSIKELSHQLNINCNSMRYYIRKNGLSFNRVYPAQRMKKNKTLDPKYFRVEERGNWIV